MVVELELQTVLAMIFVIGFLGWVSSAGIRGAGKLFGWIITGLIGFVAIMVWIGQIDITLFFVSSGFAFLAIVLLAGLS